MKRILAVVCFLLFLVGCGSAPTSDMADESVSLPLNGFHHLCGEIVVSGDYNTYRTSNYKTDATAYALTEDGVGRLTGHDVTLTIPYNGEEVVLPVRYMVHNETVYPFLTEENLEHMGVGLYPIPQGSHRFLIDGLGEVLVYDLETKEASCLVSDQEKQPYKDTLSKDEYASIAWSVMVKDGVTLDGNYVVYTTNRDSLTHTPYGFCDVYVMDLKTMKSQKIKETKTDMAPVDISIKDGAVYITYSLSGAEKEYYRYDIAEDVATPYTPEAYKGNLRSEYDHIWIKNDVEQGSVTVANTTTEKIYTLTISPKTTITGYANPSGEYLLGSYQPEGGDSSAALFDMKQGKVIDAADIFGSGGDQGFSYSTYKGHPLLLKEWVDDTTLLVAYSLGEGMGVIDNEQVRVDFVDVTALQ